MAIFHRKLLPETEPSTNIVVLCPCGSYFNGTWACCFEPSPSPPPGVRHNYTQNHVVPYLISIVCALGVAFLFLTTCTILLRNRWTRRRGSIRVISDPEDIVDEDHGPVDYPIWHIATAGLQQSAIDSITAFKYNRHEGLIEGSDCSICLTRFQEGDDLRLLPKCSHAFHISCIDVWLMSHKNCPLCRAPIIKESSSANFDLSGSSSSDLNSTGVTAQMENLENNHGGHHEGQGETSGQMRERVDGFGILPIHGVRMTSILKKNRELRVLSDLGGNDRVMRSNKFQPMRWSVSFDASAASAISDAVAAVCSDKDERMLELENRMKLEIAAKQGRGNSSVSRLRKSSSIGCSLQKAPVSMKRSSSSSGKFFPSFQRSKSQPSILPHEPKDRPCN
ncbi:hypothetical protein Nepgr_026528 [Nepenthes gracilis]|uniref:RING-type E3 ubiquitin transferase n=1 Tax=Nepenthes gracilis TaxID=150966 RepID=A0AAD3T7Y8_NEPGR|nr:hypothetical protein Nepgr_026528 [Nepenthes gracilis]